MKLPEAIWYVLRIRTNRWLIAASAVGYFFFAGMRTFGVVFVRAHFALSQTAATAILFIAGLGSLAGVLIAGRLADRLISRGALTGRVLVGAAAYVLAAALLLPALLVGSVAIALALLVLAGAALAAPNPPLDAARLDIMPSRLWGRAEGVRSLLRQTAQAGAPLLFGLVADALGGGGGTLHSGGTLSAESARALQYTFLIMLVPLAVSGISVLFWARRTYPRDVATADASLRAARV
jgi:MFS family permease